jgi:subtilisin family serine protease
VYLYGRGVPAQGRTDDQGMVTISLLNETDDSLQAIYVNPQSGHWTLWVNRPKLVSGTVNTVPLRALTESFPAFPARQMLGWGQLAMRLDKVPVGMDGRGVKVAVVDSGAAVHTHPDLAAIAHGGDFAGADPGGPGWSDDVIAHGSHCSGVIAGADDVGGIRGFAPAAEVHEARIFPGGRMSSLLDALDYCMDQGVDVVNMSLGTGGSSQIFLQKLAQARQQGVACIVAAGNSGDNVQFPGISPDVFTVAAIGQDGTFPADSYHAQVRWQPGGEDQGFFAAQFSCHGPEIDACAPGVAIVSSVPAAGYASWDGTSMATPHITGLATLVLAHHPDFTTPALQLPTAARVDRLFEILKQSCRPLSLQDPTRTGAGLPDAVRALGLDTAVRAPSAQATARETEATAIRTALDRLRQDMVAAQLLEDAPALAPQSAGPPAPPSAHDLTRELAELRAQMEAAGVFADAV